MKKHLSVLALYARNTLGRLLALLAAASVLEIALFVLQWYRRDPEQPVPTVETLLRGVPQLFGPAFLLLLLLLCRGGDEIPSVGYTLQRLRIREEAAILWKAVFNCCCLLLFWAVQAAVVLGLCRWYAAVIGPEYSSSQTVFLAFYRSAFLHNLLPLDNWSRYLRNIALILSVGFCAAVRTYKLRRGSRYGWGMLVFLWGWIVSSFLQGTASWTWDAVSALVPLIALAVDAQYLMERWGEHSEA